MRLIVFALTYISLGYVLSAQEILLYEGWKFKKGDNPDWAKPEWNDSDWQPIEVGRDWESQGYENQNGYGWYRYKVYLPSALKEKSLFKDSLKFLFGKIDDHDQFYLNGVLIAQNAYKTFTFGSEQNNASAYNLDRRYTLSVRDPSIRWEGWNTIAIRVFDQLGNGGLVSATKYSVSMVDQIDNLQLDIQTFPYVFSDTKMIKKTVILQSNYPEVIEGNLQISVKNLMTDDEVALLKIPCRVPGNQKFAYEFSLPVLENAKATYTFTNIAGNSFSVSQEIPFILTPPESEEPRINNATVFGARPGNPVLFTLAVSGLRPMSFEAKGLPKGLTLLPSGQIRGSVAVPGNYTVTFTASNTKGKDSKAITFKIGNAICLTPQMGWNSWNCWGLEVSDAKVRASAQAMVEKGLINYGWSYMNIDDGWEGARDANGILQPNEKFPDMKKLADDIHEMGLKIGIYSSPGPKTCGGYEGSYKYEEKDLNTWVSWGFDYLKYDWCSYTDVAGIKVTDFWTVPSDKVTLERLQKPYKLMQKYLEKAPRDIVYSLCQYGWGDVWKWGASVNGNSWRTTGDIEDTWNSLFGIGFSQYNLYPYAMPGRWNDPDMLIVGKVGWGPKLRNTRLTVQEQYTHITLWSILAAPLLIGCDMAQLDEFTLSLLKNAEVIAVNQDALGKQAQRVYKTSDVEVYVKELQDGGKAVAIFNISKSVKNIQFKLSELQIPGSRSIRDIWRQVDIGNSSTLSCQLAPHGCYFVKVK